MMSYGSGCQGVHLFEFYTAQYNKMPKLIRLKNVLISNIAFIAAGQRCSKLSGAWPVLIF